MSGDAGLFNARTLVILIVAGILAFLAFLILAAFEPDMRSGADGRPHGLSTSAVGFRGVHDLLEATGAEVDYVRGDDPLYGPGLVIATLDMQGDAERLQEIVDRGLTQPVLIVLPKWFTAPSDEGRDRVVSIAPAMGSVGTAQLAEIEGFEKLRVTTGNAEAGSRLSTSGLGGAYRAPTEVQVISGAGLQPMLTTPSGDIVLARFVDTQTYILAEPDLLNNQALASPERARAAMTMLGALNADSGPYRFELALNGFGNSRNLLTLAFEPPFLALTLCLITAALLAGLQAGFRFGPPRGDPRAIAFGKRALVDNSAELLRIAKREHLSSTRYVELTREAAVAALGNPRGLKGAALDQWLDGHTRSGEPFTALAARADRAKSRDDILSAAQALYQWRKAVTHEG